MKIFSLESIYQRIDNHIKLVASHTEKPYLDEVIRMCRLKPPSIIKNTHWRSESKKLELHKQWVDEFGMALEITKNKRIKIAKNTNDIICTDLYACLPLDKIIKMAKLLYLLIGKDKNYKDHAIIGMVGLDGYLRVWTLMKGEWQQVSPLKLGIVVLKHIAQNIDVKYYRELQHSKKVIVSCKEQRSWISYWPAHRDFLEQIKDYDFVVNMLGTKEK